jgi:hypothetical protein
MIPEINIATASLPCKPDGSTLAFSFAFPKRDRTFATAGGLFATGEGGARHARGYAPALEPARVPSCSPSTHQSTNEPTNKPMKP